MDNNNTKKQNTFISEEEKHYIGKKYKTLLKKHLVAKYIIAGYKKSL